MNMIIDQSARADYVRSLWSLDKGESITIGFNVATYIRFVVYRENYIAKKNNLDRHWDMFYEIGSHKYKIVRDK